MIYLDNNATTPLHPVARAAMEPFLSVEYGNPSSLHSPGRRARKALDTSREQVATLLHCRPSEVIFTSGGSEATATALHAALLNFGPGTTLISSTVEHSATRRACSWYESQGYRWVQIPVDAAGQPDLSRLEEALRSSPQALITFIWANNETGVISPIEEIAALAQRYGALLHLDAVQACGKILVDLSTLPVHFLSLSAHKLHGPKGTGALFARATVPFTPLIHGGGQESGHRSGTENVPAIAGFGAAAAQASPSLMAPVQVLRDRFESSVALFHPSALRNAPSSPLLPNTANLAFPGLDAEAILIVLDHLGVCASPGSACGSAANNPSAVLAAMGYDEARVKSSIRFSLSSMTTAKEIDQALSLLQRALERVAAAMPSPHSPVLRHSGQGPA